VAGRRTRDRKVASSTPGRGAIKSTRSTQPGLKDEKSIKSKPTRKLKHTNSIPDYFEYFCQMSSKSILIILSYTVSKFARF